MICSGLVSTCQMLPVSLESYRDARSRARARRRDRGGTELDPVGASRYTGFEHSCCLATPLMPLPDHPEVGV